MKNYSPVKTSGGSFYNQQMAKIPHILESFNQKPGFGNNLTHLLPAEHSSSSDAVAAFLCFILERQKIWSNKRKRRKVWSSNSVMTTKWFTNMYR